MSHLGHEEMCQTHAVVLNPQASVIEVFIHFDADHDDTITLEEFTTMARAFEGNHPSANPVLRMHMPTHPGPVSP